MSNIIILNCISNSHFTIKAIDECLKIKNVDKIIVFINGTLLDNNETYLILKNIYTNLFKKIYLVKTKYYYNDKNIRNILELINNSLEFKELNNSKICFFNNNYILNISDFKNLQFNRNIKDDSKEQIFYCLTYPIKTKIKFNDLSKYFKIRINKKNFKRPIFPNVGQPIINSCNIILTKPKEQPVNKKEVKKFKSTNNCPTRITKVKIGDYFSRKKENRKIVIV